MSNHAAFSMVLLNTQQVLATQRADQGSPHAMAQSLHTPSDGHLATAAGWGVAVMHLGASTWQQQHCKPCLACAMLSVQPLIPDCSAPSADLASKDVAIQLLLLIPSLRASAEAVLTSHLCMLMQHVAMTCPQCVQDIQHSMDELHKHPKNSKSGGMAPVYGMGAKSPDRGLIGEFLVAYQDVLLSGV